MAQEATSPATFTMSNPYEKTILSNLTTLLETGRFSDMTLKCDGRSFRVHRSVVCARSPMLAAACEGEFQEAKTSTVDVKIARQETMALVLKFLYTGDYEDREIHGGCPTKETEAKKTQGPASITDDFTGFIDEELANGGPVMSNVEDNQRLIVNTLVYIAADYYQISDLKEVATTKFRQALQDGCKSGLAEVCVLVYDSAPDTAIDLRSSLSSTIVNRASDLLSDETFMDTAPQLPELMKDILSGLIINHEEAQRSSREALVAAQQATATAIESSRINSIAAQQELARKEQIFQAGLDTATLRLQAVEYRARTAEVYANDLIGQVNQFRQCGNCDSSNNVEFRSIAYPPNRVALCCAYCGADTAS